MRFLILLLISFASHAQSIFTAELYVQRVEADTTVCEKRFVMWGIKKDSICFDLDQVRCYVALRFTAEVKRTKSGLDQTVITLNQLDEQTSIRYVVSEGGFLIWITNLEHQFPHFVLSTTNVCRQ